MYLAIFFALFSVNLYFFTLFSNRDKLRKIKPNKIPSVTIIIPAYNEEKNIGQTIKSLLKLKYPKNKLDIIVIDDGSKDNTYKIAKSFGKYGVRIYTKKNGGKANAMNFGLRHVKTEFVGSLDADSFVEAEALINMVGFFEDKEVMAVTPTLRIWKPRNIIQRVQRTEYLFGVFLRKIFSFIGTIHVTPGPFTIYRKKFFDKYGGYDEKTLTEDMEIAMRIQSKNYMIENSLYAGVDTVAPDNLKGLFRQRVRWYRGFIDNAIRYKHLFGSKHGNLGLIILPSALLSIGLVLWFTYFGFYYILSKIITSISNLALINFNVLPLIKRYFYILPSNIIIQLSNPMIMLSLICIILGFININLAKRFSNEKQSIKSAYLLFLLLYGPLFCVWWSIAIISRIFKLNVKW
ncbi:glycosyltransferase family 2 protein [Candidatus Pacearchaeota archaeon]|nr:glycosyltransferase family 2 protein [Candidatus Pacearchaeota archaeon]